MTDFKESLAEFVQLAARKRELDAEMKTVAALIDEMEGPLLAEMSEMGMQNTKINGVTVYINRQLWAGAMKDEWVDPDGNTVLVTNTPATCEALVECGLGDFVKPSFNTNTLSAWLREQPLDDQGQPILPEGLAGRMTVSEKFSLRTRRS